MCPKLTDQWFLIVGAVICGLTSGLFWVAEGAIVSHQHLIDWCLTDSPDHDLFRA